MEVRGAEYSRNERPESLGFQSECLFKRKTALFKMNRSEKILIKIVDNHGGEEGGKFHIPFAPRSNVRLEERRL